jgi:hypothetical protein
MSRTIYLPELQRINIKNYTLYPNGLDYSYDFVKGVNLILGGNGMGKTTFVNIIKFGLIGLYKKAKDLTRTYLDRAIVKRLLYPSNYFSARGDESIQVDAEAIVILHFFIKGTHFVVRRSLETGCLLSVTVNGVNLGGEIIEEERYERLDDKDKEQYLLYSYERGVEEHSNLTFDDLIFFVNEILFFGENHNTVLWNNGIDGRTDVQNELFNKYFNEPDLDRERQEMQRQAKYYDSLSRHRSEDMRVLNKLVAKINAASSNNTETSSPTIDIVALKSRIESIGEDIIAIRSKQAALENEISILQGEINRSSMQASRLDEDKKRIEREMNASLWETLHPQYDVFVKNIQMNHLCPMCSHEADQLLEKVNEATTHCFMCGNDIHQSANSELISQYKTITLEHKNIYQSIANKQRKIRALEDGLTQFDKDFREKDLQKRTLQQQLRELEYKRSSSVEPDKLQALDDERNRLEAEKNENQKKSAECAAKAQELTNRIEEEILSNVSRFSALFSSYAEHFLGVPCSLEYAKYEGDDFKRFYPVIDGKIRRQEESLSESQRFFVDHSFRMSILSFFYQSPSFYIVETPDSSLDLSYEKNAAGVFLQFLKKPNIIIVTSNLNNSSFVNYLTSDSNISFSMVGLPDIAKKSAVQGANEEIRFIYNEIKSRI